MRKARLFLEEVAAMVKLVEVPGVQDVPAATGMETLHSPPATHCLYEVPSLAHS